MRDLECGNSLNHLGWTVTESNSCFMVPKLKDI